MNLYLKQTIFYKETFGQGSSGDGTSTHYLLKMEAKSSKSYISFESEKIYVVQSQSQLQELSKVTSNLQPTRSYQRLNHKTTNNKRIKQLQYNKQNACNTQETQFFFSYRFFFLQNTQDTHSYHFSVFQLFPLNHSQNDINSRHTLT